MLMTQALSPAAAEDFVRMESGRKEGLDMKSRSMRSTQATAGGGQGGQVGRAGAEAEAAGSSGRLAVDASLGWLGC